MQEIDCFSFITLFDFNVSLRARRESSTDTDLTAALLRLGTSSSTSHAAFVSSSRISSLVLRSLISVTSWSQVRFHKLSTCVCNARLFEGSVGLVSPDVAQVVKVTEFSMLASSLS